MTYLTYIATYLAENPLNTTILVMILVACMVALVESVAP